MPRAKKVPLKCTAEIFEGATDVVERAFGLVLSSTPICELHNVADIDVAGGGGLALETGKQHGSRAVCRR